MTLTFRSRSDQVFTSNIGHARMVSIMGRSKKKKSNKKAATAQNRTTLKQHVRNKKRLISPLLDALETNGSPKFFRWIPDILPEMLWVASVHLHSCGHRVFPSLIYPVLDILDELVQEHSGKYPTPDCPGRFISGTLSSFADVDPEIRPEARKRLRGLKHYEDSFPEYLRVALTCYPTCPMSWVFEGEEYEIEAEVGLNQLKSVIVHYWDSTCLDSTLLRMPIMARYVKAGVLVLPCPPNPVADTFLMLCDYPDGLNEEQRGLCESTVRATFQMLQNSWSFEWSKQFWNRGPEISPCQVMKRSPRFSDQQKWLQLHKAFFDELAPQMHELRAALHELTDSIDLDLYSPERDEVLLGLLGRSYRLFNHMMFSISMWTEDMSSHFLRALVDTLIQLKWLAKQDSVEYYERYKRYAVGKKKLLMLHLEDLSDAGQIQDVEDTIEHLRSIVNEELWEEFQDVDLGGNFSGKDIRSMAIETSLKVEYDTIYSPASANVHGDWTSVAMFNMNYCLNPLHRFHRIPRYDEMGREFPFRPLLTALKLFKSSLTTIFSAYDCDKDRKTRLRAILKETEKQIRKAKKISDT